MNFENTHSFAKSLDQNDPLAKYREQYYLPIINGKDAIYFTGNSLGLQPKSTQEFVLDELEDWASFGVEGHFHARNPWKKYHEIFPELIAPIVGAKEEEVVVMNALTVNLHLLMASFYQPTKTRYKILCEEKAFPSDQYAIESRVKLSGYDPADAIIEVKAKQGKYTIDKEDILEAIADNKDSIALVLIGGVNYYSGQVFDMQTITKSAQEAGAYCGWDLAHAVGNVPLSLHEWNVDFAAWCTYKYLNSGPGGVGGVFLHERHATNKKMPRMAGWWGQKKETRFLMEKEFDPIPTAEGWQLSNAPILSMAAHQAALQLFAEAGMEKLVSKGKQLHQYMRFLLEEINKEKESELINIITPENEGSYGCQLSLLIQGKGKTVFDFLKSKGVIADWREPNVIRIAPVAMYNTFEDVYLFASYMREAVGN